LSCSSIGHTTFFGINNIIVELTELYIFVDTDEVTVFVSLGGSGSDAASLTTSAKRDGDYYILNGSKVKKSVLF